MTEAKDWITAQPKASEQTQQTDVERAAWEGVRAMFEHRHGVGTCPNERLEDLKRANEVGETWEEYLIACRAAISAMRPSVDREKLREIRERHAGFSETGWLFIGSDGEQAHNDRAFLLQQISNLGDENGY